MIDFALLATQKSIETGNDHFAAKVLLLLMVMVIFSLFLKAAGRKN